MEIAAASAANSKADTDAAQAELDAARKELSELRAEAAAKRAGVDLGGAPTAPAIPDIEDVMARESQKFTSRGGFNASAIQGLQGGAVDSIASNTERTAKATEKMASRPTMQGVA